jgi:hypothetical protein
VKRRRKLSRKAKARKSGPISLLDIRLPAKRSKPTPEQEVELVETVKCFIEAVLRQEEQQLWVPRITEPDFPRVPAIELAENPLSAMAWLSEKVAQRKKAGDIPTSMTVLARQLAPQMVVDAQTGKCLKAIPWRSIRARLYEKKLSRLR